MKAAITKSVGAGFEVEDIDISDPIGREVLVDVKASGLCHSDLHIEQNDFGFPMPILLGHEAAGEVIAIGPDVSGVNIGNHVVACLIQYC